MESQGFNGYHVPGANQNNPYDQNGYSHDGMVCYPQQPNFQFEQNFYQPAAFYAPVSQPSYYEVYNQQQYAPPRQYQEHQHHQQNQLEIPSLEHQDQSPNTKNTLCDSCRTVIRKKLIPVLQELGCLEQSDINERSGQSATRIAREDDKCAAHELGSRNAENKYVYDKIQPSNAATVLHQSQQPEVTVAQDIVKEHEDQEIVLDGSAEMKISDLSETPVEEPKFDIQQIEFGYTPDSSIVITPSSPGLSIEEVVAFDENEYVEDFPSLSSSCFSGSGNTMGTATISKTLKKKLKKEKSVEKKENVAGIQESATPPASKRRQRKPKRFITLSDILAPSDVPTNKPSPLKNSSASLIKVDQPQNGNANSVPRKTVSNNARKWSQIHEIRHRASKIAGKKQSTVTDIQMQYRPKLSFPNVLKSAIKTAQNVSTSQKKNIERRINDLEKGQKYLSKAERKQLNEEKAQRQLPSTPIMVPKNLEPAPTESHSTDNNTENELPPLTSKNNSNAVDAVSANSQESEIDKNQDAQISQKAEGVSTENSLPAVCNLEDNPDMCKLGNPENNPHLPTNVNKTDQDVVLSAKDRRSMFNASLREQKKTRKESLLDKGENESSDLLPFTNSTTPTNDSEAESTSNARMNNIESTSSALLLPPSTHDDMPNCKNMHLEVNREIRMYWDAIKKFRYAYLAFNIPNVELELYKDDSTNLGMQILQKLQQTPVIDCRSAYYKKNHSVLWEKRIQGCQQVKNDEGRTMKLFERCQCERNNICLQDIAALNSLGLSDEHVNKYYPAMVSAIARKYAPRESFTYEITPEYIKKHVETGFDDKYLVYYCNYVNRQLCLRYFNDPIEMKSKIETRLLEVFRVSFNKEESLQCNQQRCKTVFRGLSQAMKKKGFKKAASMFDFLRKTNSSIITTDYFNICKTRDPEISNLLGIWFGYTGNA